MIPLSSGDAGIRWVVGIWGGLGALLTFTLLLQFALGFKAAHLEGVELKYMGQQLVGQYPIHFHLAGDLDERGGYDPPTYIRDLSIHHTFSRCVTVHGSNGLLVSACWRGSLSRDLGHAEKGDLGLCLLSCFWCELGQTMESARSLVSSWEPCRTGLLFCLLE